MLMDTNLQPSSRVIFLYSLPKSVVEPMQMKGVDYKSVIKMIGDFDGVEVYDLNRKFFSKPHNCNILIILGEFLEDKNALLLQDDTIFPIADLVNLVGSSFREVNVIDCAWCYSGKGKTHDELKKLTNALVNTINGYTAVESRLALYWLLLKDNKLLGRDNYKDFYDKKLSNLGAYQDSMNPKQLASLSEGTNLGTMSTSAAPETIYRKSPFPVKVYIHAVGDEIDINVEIKQYQQHKRRNLKINNGDQVRWEINFDTEPKTEYAKYLEYIKGERLFYDTWKSDNPELRHTFNFFVEEEFPLNGFNGVLKTIIGENKLDEWAFTINILPFKDDKAIDKGLNLERQGKESEPKTEYDIISKVSYDAVQREYGDKNLNQLKEYIEKQMNKTEDTHMIMSPELYHNYKEIKNEIDKLQEYNKKSLYDKWKRLYVCDKRLKMLIELKSIRDIIIPFAENKKDEKTNANDRAEIKKHSTSLFWLIEYDKIDVEVYSIINKVYKDDNGDELSRFPKGDLRMAYNGLAIKMAYKDIDDSLIYCYTDYKNDHPKKNEKLPQANSRKKNDTDDKDVWVERRRLVKREVLKYLNGLTKDKDIQLELEKYLEKEPSSIFASYLRALYD